MRRWVLHPEIQNIDWRNTAGIDRLIKASRKSAFRLWQMKYSEKEKDRSAVERQDSFNELLLHLVKWFSETYLVIFFEAILPFFYNSNRPHPMTHFRLYQPISVVLCLSVFFVGFSLKRCSFFPFNYYVEQLPYTDYNKCTAKEVKLLLNRTCYWRTLRSHFKECGLLMKLITF